VKKGKQEQYVKDDEALDAYLIQLALENTELFPGPDLPAIRGTALEALVNEYSMVYAIVERLSKTLPKVLLEQLIQQTAFDPEKHNDKAYVEQWTAGLQDRLNIYAQNGNHFESAVIEDTERQVFRTSVNFYVHGIATEYPLRREFFLSKEYKLMVDLGLKLEGLIEKGAYVIRDEKKQEIASFKEAVVFLMKEAKRGLTIQRYKGLGEMNPDQLWETTMNQENRRMLQVKIEDAVKANDLFTTLMGDQVEPRKEFIQSNALDVENLDV